FSLVMIFLYRYSSLWREYALFVFIYALAGAGIGPLLKKARLLKRENLALGSLLALTIVSFLSLFGYYAEFQAQRAPFTYEAICRRTAIELRPYVKEAY